MQLLASPSLRSTSCPSKTARSAKPPGSSRQSIRPSIRGGRFADCQQARLTAFFDFPGEDWKHLRTTNVVESPFATVRLRERATMGADSRTKGLLMAFKPLDMAQRRWRRPIAPPARRRCEANGAIIRQCVSVRWISAAPNSQQF
jgi:hypothetical protein